MVTEQASNPQALTLDLTAQEPIPAAGVEQALALMASGKMHRYGEAGGKPSEASALEAAFAEEIGARYCVAMNSCGSTMFIALHALGVRAGDKVLANCFTLAPVPGAIAHCGAEAVLVDCTDDYTIDLEDLERKARASGARVLLLSHMRGHICDMQRLSALCAELGLQLVEDCAHTMGASWDGRPTGTWGQAGCFSLQSYKHANAGEGGLLTTNDEDIAAQAILLSGSYMLYDTHTARPDSHVFERWKFRTPNFSLRMSNLAAAVARPQLGAALVERAGRWNARYAWLADGLREVPGVSVPERDVREQFVQSSIQFSVPDLSPAGIKVFIEGCGRRGLHIKWFGADQPVGFTSVSAHWQFLGKPQALPNARRVLAQLCDFRIPLSLTRSDCLAIVQVIREEMRPAAGQ